MPGSRRAAARESVTGAPRTRARSTVRRLPAVRRWSRVWSLSRARVVWPVLRIPSGSSVPGAPNTRPLGRAARHGLRTSDATGAGPLGRPAAARPSILLVTLDTTRADAIGPEAAGVETPAFNALAQRGRRFRQAYATVPETLPSHASMMTGLYPAGHGVHQNARPLAATYPVLAEKLRGAGYRTAAFVSAFVLARRFGLARGFDVYDDALPAGRAERARDGDDGAGAGVIGGHAGQPLFLWVHYFDPHAPYAAARAVPQPLRRPALPGRDRGDGRAARPPRAGVRAARGGPGRDRDRRRPRRGARRSRRVASTATSSTNRRCTCRCC